MWWIDQLLRALIGALILTLVVGTGYYIFSTSSGLARIESRPASTGPDVEPEPMNYPGPSRKSEWKFDFPDIGAMVPSVSTDEPGEGLGAFADPGAMVIGNWYPLQFIAGPDEDALAGEAPGANLTEPQQVYISRTMRVTLLPNPNFEMQPTTPAVQDSGRDRTASWQWNLKPLQDGMHRLSARVEAGRERPDGSFDAWDSRTRQVSIRVKIGTWEGFVRAIGRATTAGNLVATLFASWEKTVTALGALIIALGALRLAIQYWRRPDATSTSERTI